MLKIRVLLFGAFLLLIVGGGGVLLRRAPLDFWGPFLHQRYRVLPDQPLTHIHADLALYINGRRIDLSQDRYQSTEEQARDRFAHMHDGNGQVLHIHREGVSLGYGMNALGIPLTNTCIVVEVAMYCGSADDLQVWVNGTRVSAVWNYVVRDNDQILITFGRQSSEDVHSQLLSLSNLACIYSETCPERGVPPTEECVGGLGSQCDIH